MKARRDKLTEEQQQLAADHIHLARWVARRKRYILPREDLDEVISICNLGLCLAARAYDPDRGVQFSTYACRTMLSCILRRRGRDDLRRIPVVHSDWEECVSIDRDLEWLEIQDEARWVVSHSCLSEVQRDALRLYYLEGEINQQDIGLQLGFSSSWFSMILKRIRKKMQGMSA